MIVRTHARSLLPVVVIASLIGCFGGNTEFKRNGPDLIVRGATTVYDSIPGDVILVGGDFVLGTSASTGGDYLGAAGNQDIHGRVHGSLRAAGGEIHLRGSVDRNATIAGGNIELDSASVIGGNVYVAGGNVEIHGTVRGAVLASAGNVDLNGAIGSDVEVSGGALHIGPRTQIAGKLRYRVAKDKVKIDSAARITGTITALPVKKGPGLRRILWALGFVVVAIVLAALFPRFFTEAAEVLPKRPVAAALLGVAWICLIPIAVVILAVTMIGLPLAILAGVLWLIIVLIGDLPVALWLGKRLLSSRARPGRGGTILGVLIGALILMLLGIMPVVGNLIAAIAAAFGVGAMLLRAWPGVARQSV
ncbi:MAG: hypothetical protein ACJ78J_09425 [Gemmatimonadaceae bacterium]